MSDLKLAFTIKQVNENEEVIGQVNFDKDIIKKINLTTDSVVKYLSKKIEEVILDMDDKKIVEYKWKEATVKANKIDENKE